MKQDEEVARIVGWLQGFAWAVWMLPLALMDGAPLVDGEA